MFSGTLKQWQEANPNVTVDACVLFSPNFSAHCKTWFAPAALLLPSHGGFDGASSLPFADYKRRPGDRVGLNWRIPGVMGKRAVRHVSFDTNFWKSFVFARLAVAMADKGSLALFGQKPEAHRLFAEHLVAEYRVRTEGRGRTVDEWNPRPGQPDNHWLDGIVLCGRRFGPRSALARRWK